MSNPTSTVEIGIDHIVIDAQHADERRGDGKAIDELARSITAHGVQSPIRVYPKGQKYGLVFGRRRVLAATVAGLNTIRAEVLEEKPSQQEILEQRTVENLDRKDLTPIEEAQAVAALIEAARTNDNDAQAIEIVAGKLGRSPRWVRDRAYLERLSDRVCKMVDSGELSLGQAREIAKLVDRSMQDKIAEWACRYDDGTGTLVGGWSLHKVRDWVTRHLNSLRLVSWPMDVAFAGAPACAECPHNSANELDLFEHDEDKPAESGVCLSAACFTKKQRAVDKALNRAVPKAVAMINDADDKAAALPDAACSCCPKSVKLTSFKRRVKKAAGLETKKKKATTSTTRQERTPTQIAHEKYREAENEWWVSATPQLEDALLAHPAVLAVIAMYDNSLLSCWGYRSAENDRIRPQLMKLAFTPIETIEWLGGLVAPLKTDRGHLDIELGDLHDEVVDELVSRFEIDVPQRPKLEDFLPEQEKPAAGAKPKKKARRKAKRKKKAATA